jgi:acetyl esterase/lipase
MPEANGLDILQDIRDFYNWLATPNNLDAFLPDGVSADLENMLVTGESAGGWLALQSALLPASRKRIAAVISHYPMIDMRDRYYTEDYEKQIFTPVAPQLPQNILRDYRANLKGGEVVSSGVPPDSVPLVISALQQGRFAELFGGDSSLYPIEALESVTDLPPTWVLHGTGDTVIPVEGSHKYEKRLREKLPDAKLHVSYRTGDHGFDNDPSVTLDTDWIKQGVEFVEQFWPKK